jgi:hypothetical protein
VGARRVPKPAHDTDQKFCINARELPCELRFSRIDRLISVEEFSQRITAN